jgi:hypothetical protein
MYLANSQTLQNIPALTILIPPSRMTAKQYNTNLPEGARPAFFLLFFCLNIYGARAQQDSSLFPGHSGFRNKANATNTVTGGVRQGLWLEYIDSALYITNDTHAPYYMLTYYLNGEPYGKAEAYYSDGKLWSVLQYAGGKKNGTEKVYFKDGKLNKEIPYSNGLRNGVYKIYFENGVVKEESPYSMGKLNGAQKAYFPNGKLNVEIEYLNGQAGNIKVYGADGKEVK